MDILRVLGRIVVMPITVLADIITMGGVLTDQPQSYTGKNIEKILDDCDEE